MQNAAWNAMNRMCGISVSARGEKPTPWRNTEDLAVALLPGTRALANRLDRRLDELVGHRDVEADLVGEADLHRGAAIGLNAVELASVALHASDGDPPYLGAV